jgi:hypothetical protein
MIPTGIESYVNLDWLTTKIRYLKFGETVDSAYWDACRDILNLLEKLPKDKVIELPKK